MLPIRCKLHGAAHWDSWRIAPAATRHASERPNRPFVLVNQHACGGRPHHSHLAAMLSHWTHVDQCVPRCGQCHGNHVR